ncbi:TetR-like C-terminal domain-containing protein [Mycolicibacterium gadium]|uniref:TetR/AcrR family transcriptional regulator C-terminal ligand-binding domain-containing protein n=1 Tax=Mycolicibacterium gadium TaxID=1794 RepID=A0ABT6GNF2_MYCGU|nr:TetR-like C-terminal domain-containing protein [Mycolicibacterium gadium]MDG5483368.1 TetR/AcrR family transcriptional regulator C-terminal ligand-binding domain-containing protein [Mycolicibacterium gadium]
MTGVADEASTGDPRVARSRAAVLAAAVDLLVEGGAPALTIEAVVQRSRIARSTVYRHWPRRIDLVADTFRTLIPPLPPAATSGDLRSRLVGVLRVLAAQINDEKYAAVVPAVLGSAARDPELAMFGDDFARSQRAPLDVILRTFTMSGELPADLDRDGAIAALVGPLLFRRIVFGQNVDADYADALVDAFLRAHQR